MTPGIVAVERRDQARQEQAVQQSDWQEAAWELRDFLAQQPGAKATRAAVDEHFNIEHEFVGALYVRTVHMPAGTLCVTCVHKHEHPYFVTAGRATVVTDTGRIELKAGHRGITAENTQRVLYVHEDCTWTTVHTVGEERDLERIEEHLVEYRPTPEELRQLAAETGEEA